MRLCFLWILWGVILSACFFITKEPVERILYYYPPKAKAPQEIKISIAEIYGDPNFSVTIPEQYANNKGVIQFVCEQFDSLPYLYYVVKNAGSRQKVSCKAYNSSSNKKVYVTQYVTPPPPPHYPHYPPPHHPPHR